MKYHLFKRNLKRNGKSVIQWYYWFYDENGKQVRKSCGSDGKPCLLKREAEKFITELLEHEEEIKKQEIENKKILLQDMADTMFAADSTYLKLYQARGIELTPQTIYLKMSLFNKHIRPIFGSRDPATIVDAEIENWLINLSLSNSSKNNILGVFREILTECKRNKIINSVPEIKSFRRKAKKKDIISIDEIKKLFPNTPEELEKVWQNKRQELYFGIDNQCHSYDFMFALMFKIILVTGMRIGEIAAISISQYKGNGFILDRMIDSQRKLQFYLKKGSEDNPKSRAVIIPKSVSQLINYYLTIRPQCSLDYMFVYRDNFCRKELIEQRFKYGLQHNNILTAEIKRKLTPHSLRFTYNTYMVNAQFPQQVLRKMIGHNSEEMTDYYTRPDMNSQLAGLQVYQDSLDTLWG